MPTDLNSYLASRYLVTDPKPTKKRKRKHADAESGLLIADDDSSGWAIPASRQGDDNDTSTGPVVVAGTSAEFRKTKSSNWKSLSAPSGSNRDANTDGADAIIEAAAAEHEAALRGDDEGPTIAEGPGVASSAGSAIVPRKRAPKTSTRSSQEEASRRRDDGAEAETAYRDAAGNRIDISMRRAQARQAAAAAEEKERLAREALKGDAQKVEALRRREQLEDAALMPLARGADDEELNRGLREEVRWNDPMAQFLGAKQASGGKRAGSKRNAPVYTGPAPPNRYGLRPGYRWDGVDRSNGFELERFKAFNRREMNKDLEYAWQMDV